MENLQLICDSLHISLRNFFDVPSEQDTEQDRLLRQIAGLMDDQKQALALFLETMSR